MVQKMDRKERRKVTVIVKPTILLFLSLSHIPVLPLPAPPSHRGQAEVGMGCGWWVGSHGKPQARPGHPTAHVQ